MADGVQIYGAFDVGVLVRGSDTNGNPGNGTSSQVASGLNGHNGIGFRMSEDLGNGMKISGDAMFGFALDSGGNRLGLGSDGANGGGFTTIYSYLALSGDFGTVIAGRAGGARAGFIKKYDPFGGFGVGGALGAYGASSGNADYADNVLAWITPEILPGFKVLAAYTSNLVGQDFSPKLGSAGVPTPLYAIAGLYAAGPVDITVAYENLTLDNFGGAGHRDVWTGAASYDLGMVKLMGLYAYVEGLDRGWQVGASAPLSDATTLKVGYVTTSNNSAGGNDVCSKVAIGVNHDLSKRTRIYADAAHLTDHEANSSCAAGLRTYGGDYANSGAGRDNSAGYGQWGMNVGVRHSF